jgi:hypothetical protein
MDTVTIITQPNIIFAASGLVGMAAHYIKKWARSETSSSIIGYFGKDNINATLNTFGAYCVAVIGALGTGVITSDMNVYGIIYAGLTMGFAVDSSFNRGTST